MNTQLGRLGQFPMTNKSGGAHAQGDVCVTDTANAEAVVNTTTSGYASGVVWVCIEPNGVANNGIGMYANFGVVPKLKLVSSANIGDLIKCHSVATEGTPHAAPFQIGDFAQALDSGTTPKACLFGPRSSGASITDGGIDLPVDGGGVAIVNGTKYFFSWKYSGTLTGWDLIADQAGNITFDVQDATYAGFPGAAASIFGTVPSLAAAQKNQASGLSIAVTKGHWAQVVITGAGTITFCTLALYITRS